MSALLWLNLGFLGVLGPLNLICLMVHHQRLRRLEDGLLDHYRHIKMLEHCEEIGAKAFAGIQQRVDKLELAADFRRAVKAEAKP